MSGLPLASGHGLDPALRLGPVHLTVADLERMVGFYTSLVGMTVSARDDRRVRLGVGPEELLVLTEDRAARPVPGRTGLFHFAVLVPSRVELSRTLKRLAIGQAQLTGFSDHLVSEAIYLNDPEGNGIEVYRDRPPQEWPLADGHIRMTSDPLDIEGVLEETAEEAEPPELLADGTRMGHVHLRVADVEQAEAFWHRAVGFDVMARYAPNASFVAVGGYHHHLGMNQWESAGAPQPPPHATGLRRFEARVSALPQIAGAEPVDGGLAVTDPSGNRMHLLLT